MSLLCNVIYHCHVPYLTTERHVERRHVVIICPGYRQSEMGWGKNKKLPVIFVTRVHVRVAWTFLHAMIVAMASTRVIVPSKLT